MPKHKHEQRNEPEYEVGYKKPPKSTQFKKGQSGNPRGRPKKKPERLDVSASFAKALQQVVPVNADGKVRHITMLEALFQQVVRKAVSGNAAAQRIVMPAVIKLAGLSPANDDGASDDSNPADLQKELDQIFSSFMSSPDPVPTIDGQGENVLSDVPHNDNANSTGGAADNAGV